MTPRFPVALALALTMAGVGSGLAASSAFEPWKPPPLLSHEDLVNALISGYGADTMQAADQAARLGSEYVSLLAGVLTDKDRNDEHTQRSVAIALGRIGDANSIAALRAVLADSGYSGFRRASAAHGLAQAGSIESIPLMSQVAASVDDPLLVQGIHEAVDWLQHPEHYRPVIDIESGSICFWFLRDDISAITYGPAGGEPMLAFRADEYDAVCRLLQAGLRGLPVGVVGLPNELVLSLRDGRRARLRTDGVLFDFSSWVPGGPAHTVIECRELGEFISMCLDQRSSESPN